MATTEVNALTEKTTQGVSADTVLINDSADSNAAKKQQMGNLMAGFVPVLTDGTRGAAGNAGRVIFNSTDGQLNIDDGTNWTLPDGTTT